MHNWFLAFKESMKFIIQDADVEVIILKYGKASLYKAYDRHTIFFSPYSYQVFLIQSTKLSIISSLF